MVAAAVVIIVTAVVVVAGEVVEVPYLVAATKVGPGGKEGKRA